MEISIYLSRPWPAIWVLTVLVIIVYVMVLRRPPGWAVPLGLGEGLRSWLAAAAGRAPAAIPGSA